MITDPKTVIARRAAQLLPDGAVVNLGVGIPTLIPSFLSSRQIYLHSENGILGVGPRPDFGHEDPNLIDAGKRLITAQPGASYFSSADAFAMIRGGHIDIAVLGALQVAEQGDLASWAIPGKDHLGVGGAMDLARGAGKVIVTMTHCDALGASKIVPECTYELTARQVVSVIVTELALFEIIGGRLVLRECEPGVSLEFVRSQTTATFEVAV